MHTYIRPWRVYMGWVWFYLSSWVKISWNLFWQIQIQLKSVLCKRRELVGEKMINMWCAFSMFDEVWINFGENFYAVESAWRVQRNSNIILREIPEAFHFFIIFLDTMAIFSCEFLLKFWCIPFAYLLKFSWIPFTSFAFLFAVFMHFWFFKGISYEFLMHVLCISYEFLTHFLCNSYAFLMQFLCSFYNFIRFGQKCMQFWQKCMKFLKLHKNCIRSA